MNSFITLPMLDQLSRLSNLTGFHSLIYNMKFKNDQIRIRQSDFSCICGIKDKLHTNVILQQKETRQAGVKMYNVFFIPRFSLWFCFRHVELESLPNLSSVISQSYTMLTILALTNLSANKFKRAQL